MCAQKYKRINDADAEKCKACAAIGSIAYSPAPRVEQVLRHDESILVRAAPPRLNKHTNCLFIETLMERDNCTRFSH